MANLWTPHAKKFKNPTRLKWLARVRNSVSARVAGGPRAVSVSVVPPAPSLYDYTGESFSNAILFWFFFFCGIIYNLTITV